MDSHIRTRRDFLKAAGVCAAGVALAGCADSGPGPAPLQTCRRRPIIRSKPNILWITCEDISPYLGCYGDPLAITPNLDRLAGRSILYTNAYATAPVCSPSRSCLITGVYATSLGTQHLRSEIAIPRQIEPFPKLLRAAGYYCSNNVKEDYNFKDPTIWDDSSATAHWRNRGRRSRSSASSISRPRIRARSTAPTRSSRPSTAPSSSPRSGTTPGR